MVVRGKTGSVGLEMETILYRVDKQQGPTVYSSGNYIQYPVINHHGEEYLQKNIYTYITEPLCYTPENGTTL